MVGKTAWELTMTFDEGMLAGCARDQALSSKPGAVQPGVSRLALYVSPGRKRRRRRAEQT
jgi:hypothetical protein